MVDYIKKHKILTAVVVFLIFLLTLFSFIMNYPTSDEVNGTTSVPEPLSNFEGYWKSGGVYMDIDKVESVHFVIDYSDQSQVFNGTYIDDENGGLINFDDETNWDCTCYKEGDNGLNVYYVSSSDNKDQDLAFTRIDENTFNEAKSKVETYLADKGSANNAGTTGQAKSTTSGYKAGTYKVGTDMPAGEYVLTNTSKNGYVEITSDSSGQLDSILANDNFEVMDYMIVYDGEYVKLGNGVTATPIDEFNVSDMPSLLQGTYKVGRDLPAGEYQVTTSGDSGYWERNSGAVSSDSEIIANENFQNSTYVTVNDGEYLKLSNGAMLVKN